ncbi:TetR/AcrR family transcriptional regulator [Nocardioides sp. cx-173]|uniref:TetR/AcrR family transcriptional regulator n=1 Tax=Nocardioides sp. cx-173 TaxID=2898796 RepID=UPI001E4594B2|nr:TetR/AcrR family transcriptional regulator [Nocardioides sp. cx-173]MCD4524703.1 TetR/AcrR family transcriptional regulator [Nocardioides sp. cx-173]UGB43213.1 TetR/AcrR family transcriptional regulator [Nocardioides sp. cx-173]
MDGLRSLPLLDDGPVERSDAARNREALLAAASELVHESAGVQAVTMDAVAARAGVGKGTVYRRFESREGLMAALLNRSETAWQASVLSGPPPLGPGAPPLERLLAFGHSRMETNLLHGELIQAAGQAGSRAYAAVSFTAMHVRYLLTEIGVGGDVPMLATALLAPLEIVILEQQLHLEQIPLERIQHGWDDLVRRVVSGGVEAPQPVGEPVDKRTPGGLDHVVTDPDGHP